jgi:predicted MPP superfamily phosphohydrolase
MAFLAVALATHMAVAVQAMRSPWAADKPANRRLIAVAITISGLWISLCVLGSLHPFASLLPKGDWIAWTRGIGEIWGLLSIGSGILFLLLFRFERQYQPERREFLTAARTAVLASPALLTGYGVFAERKAFQVEEVDLRVPGLAPDLQGLRILHLSDLHLSPFLSEKELARVVDIGNETRSHVAMVTGDFITGPHDDLEACIRQLSRLKCEAGIYGCNGNHEIFARAEHRAQQLAARHGIQILRHQSQELRFGDARINLTGVDYQHFRNPYLVGAEKLIQPGKLNLLLSHNPDVFPVAAEQGWDVTLAGHTHGGQVTVEILHQWANVARMFTPYVYGRYEKEGKSLYVTRGIGTVGIPARIGAPPEVSVIRLCAS